MAILRYEGVHIEGSGNKLCWTEADLYGSATVKQIVDRNLVKRGIDVHLIVLQALFGLFLL